MVKNIYSLELSKKEIDELFSVIKDTEVKAPSYALWQCREENCVITAYESGKVVFQGKDAFVYASKYIKEKEENYPQAGSDEVGTGDYFGPVCVCATYVTEEEAKWLNELGIKDSKAIQDSYILKVGPELIKKLTHSLVIVDNEKYNEVHEKYNMNAIKAKLHNQAFINLSKKIQLPKDIIIDQFTPEKSYYAYLTDDTNIIKDITFETKAENKYHSVAVSSIIARYAFLKKLEEMNKEYDFTFIKGASSLVDECAQEFVEKFGYENLYKVAKLHFKNTEKLQ